MEPVGVSRMLALMPAGHAKGCAEPLRSTISISEILTIRRVAVAAGRGKKCEKSHILSERAGANS